MRPNITKMADGVFRVRVSTPRGADGKRGELSEVVHGTERDAQLVHARLMLQSGRGRSAVRSLTVYDFLRSVWLPAREDSLRPLTVAGYEQLISSHIARLFADVRLVDALPYTLSNRLSHVEKPGARLKVYALLRTAFRFALRQGFIDSDPMQAVERPKTPTKSAIAQAQDVYSPDEVPTLLEYFRGDAIESAVIIGLTCGLRRSEICGLDWTDIRAARDGRGELHVSRGYHEGRRFEEPKSARSRRVVSIPASAMSRLMEIRGPVAILGPVLTDASGNRMAPRVLSQRWRRAIAKSGLRYLPMKNLRHTHATLTLAAGVDVVDVSRRLGHSTVSVTDAFYLRPGREADERAADGFDSIFTQSECRIVPPRHA